MSNLSSTLSASKARTNFYDILDEVGKGLRRFTITLRGEEKAVVLSPEEVASWEETMDILANSELVNNIKIAEKELARGEFMTEKQAMGNLDISEKDLK